MTGEAPKRSGRDALRRLRSALRWKRAEMGGSILLAALGLVAGVAALVGGAVGVIGAAVGTAIGLMLGALGGWMLSVGLEARRDLRALVGGNLPRARLGRRRA